MRELFLVSFSGIRYGVWKDEILSVRGLDALHRIPLSPACIAGILIDDGQTVTLADLPACIGYGHSTEIRQGSILLMEEGEQVTGFVVSGKMDTQSIPPELLFPLPDFLRTPVFDFCAVHDGIPIPIINVAELYSRVMQAGKESSADSLRIPAVQPQDISGKARIRIFSAGGELYAASAAGIGDKAVKPGVVTPLPNMPQYVKGVTFRDGRLLPVIDLSQRIKRQGAVPEALMLIAKIGDDAFGFLVDGDEGTLPADEVAFKPAPMIVQTSWLKQVVVRAGELIPLADLAIALSPGAADEKPVWQRYAPGSRFPDLFFRHDVDVVEFSLLGERHALPKQEVEDVIAFKPCRELPDAPPIVIGVAGHNGEILPVVDLAMMFGRRSLATPVWRMMLVSNGDFRALVITETVFKERRLPLDIHRAVPIHLPHDLMYGCYPDAEAVRLILNVEAISVYFEKSLIQKFLPALSHEMRMMSAEAQPALEVVPAVALSTAEHEALAVREQASVHRKADEPVQEAQQQAVEVVVEPSQVQEAVTAAPAIAPEPEPMDIELVTAPSASTQESPPSSGEWSEWDTDEMPEQESVPLAEGIAEAMPEETIEPEPAIGEQPWRGEDVVAEQDDLAAASSQIAAELQQQAGVEDVEFTEVHEAVTEAPAIAPEPELEPEREPMDIELVTASSASTQESLPSSGGWGEWDTDETLEREHVPHAAAVPEEMIMPESITAAAKQTEFSAPMHGVSVQQLSGESSKAREPVAMSEHVPDEVLIVPSQKDLAQKEPAAASLQESPNQESVNAQPEVLSSRGAAASAPDVSRPSEPVHAPASAGSGAPYRIHQKERTAGAWKRRIAYGAVVAALVAVLYVAGTSHLPDVEKSVKVTEPASIAQTESARTQIEPARPQPGQVKEAAEPAKAKTETLVQAELPHPAEKPRAPLELDIPKGMPTDIDVYVVKKDDTLWNISERFTGNPFNYPRIAGENRIADPDLIFPGQKINLKK